MRTVIADRFVLPTPVAIWDQTLTERLELELTESRLIDESNQQKSILSGLRAMGIDLSI
ncbi:MAG: hypothetical protein V7459_03115 [Oceanicoccus sp.]